MKAYRELSKEISQLNLQEIKFPEVRHYEPARNEASLAGKMKTRRRHRHNISPGSTHTSSHTDYIGELATLHVLR